MRAQRTPVGVEPGTVSDEPRFKVVRRGSFIGILDQKNKMFAPFFDAGPTPVDQRVRHTVIALNMGDETPTGYAWEKA